MLPFVGIWSCLGSKIAKRIAALCRQPVITSLAGGRKSEFDEGFGIAVVIQVIAFLGCSDSKQGHGRVGAVCPAQVLPISTDTQCHDDRENSDHDHQFDQ